MLFAHFIITRYDDDVDDVGVEKGDDCGLWRSVNDGGMWFGA